jgi:hypothetical protein
MTIPWFDIGSFAIRIGNEYRLNVASDEACLVNAARESRNGAPASVRWGTQTRLRLQIASVAGSSRSYSFFSVA